MAPIIGITVELDDDHLREVERALRSPVERLGCLALILPRDTPVEHLDEVIGLLDGVVLSGGADVDPAHYGEELHPLTRPIDPAQDAFELAIARRALALDMPVLGVCRGCQVLAVADGGTLVQDVETLHDGAHHHRHDWNSLALEPPGEHWHDVVVEVGSRAASWFGDGPQRVNSFHHQCVARTGRLLVPTVRAADGSIEAVERTDGVFGVGLQWHNELMWRHDERFLGPHLDHVRAVQARAAALR